MKMSILAGVSLIVLSVMALVFQGITYSTHQQFIDVGPLRAETEREEAIPLPPPAVGGILLAGGIVLVLAGSAKAQGPAS
jgi:uncharacterized membrane protein